MLKSDKYFERANTSKKKKKNTGATKISSFPLFSLMYVDWGTVNHWSTFKSINIPRPAIPSKLSQLRFSSSYLHSRSSLVCQIHFEISGAKRDSSPGSFDYFAAFKFQEARKTKPPIRYLARGSKNVKYPTGKIRFILDGIKEILRSACQCK